MGMIDVVVDTNVLMHANNPEEERFEDTVCFLGKLSDSQTLIAVDEGFSEIEANNRSLIGAEYLAKLVPGTLPHVVLMELARNGRIVQIKVNIPKASLKKLNQMLRNKRDRTFIRVCINSQANTLVSHDYLDFDNAKRRDFSKEFGISVVEAKICSACL